MSNNNNASSGSTLVDMSLTDMFDDAQKIFDDLENTSLSSTDDKYQDMVRSAIRGFMRVVVAVNQRGLFSPNEELDDVNTENLKYLLAPYYIAELMMKIVDSGNPAAQLENLKRAKAQFNNYLTKCESLRVIDKEDLVAIHREKPADPFTKRTELLQRIQRDKADAAKLEALRERKKALLAKKHESEATSQYEGDLEEVEREHYIIMLRSCVRKAIKQLEMIDKELPLLERFAQAQQQQAQSAKKQVTDGRAPSATGKSSPTRLVAPGQGFVSQAALLKSERERIQSEVFMDRNPWTVSLEEFGEQEFQRMQAEKERAKQHPPKHEHDASCDHSDDEESDAATMKARSWDDWKDDNPRGAGNMMR